ncbi:MAG: hypothetical protein M3O31_09460 [Acidobacteriota bacterium]|nr:hypothetical protein [Acidobacteriota bacterium]
MTRLCPVPSISLPQTSIWLSGALDDGSAGISAIKRCGGIAIVQAPADALVGDMPTSAIRAGGIDHVVAAQEIASVIKHIVEQPGVVATSIPDDLKLEAQIAETGRSSVELENRIGDLSPFTCPDCGGPLWKQRHDGLRYRCLTGHALSCNSLEKGLNENVDAALWAAIRQFEQRANLLQAMAQEEENKGRQRTAASQRDREADARSHADVLRQLLLGGLNRQPVSSPLQEQPADSRTVRPGA